MATAVQRYKAERGWNNVSLAEKVGVQEHALAKGCCLLSEQTGYGAEDSDTGDTLMEETRGIMTRWENEVICQLYQHSCLFWKLLVQDQLEVESD